MEFLVKCSRFIVIIYINGIGKPHCKWILRTFYIFLSTLCYYLTLIRHNDNLRYRKYLHFFPQQSSCRANRQGKPFPRKFNLSVKYLSYVLAHFDWRLPWAVIFHEKARHSLIIRIRRHEYNLHLDLSLLRSPERLLQQRQKRLTRGTPGGREVECDVVVVAEQLVRYDSLLLQVDQKVPPQYLHFPRLPLLHLYFPIFLPYSIPPSCTSARIFN